MDYQKVEMEMTGKQRWEFNGTEVSRTKDNKYLVYEPPKGHWVIVEREFRSKPSAHRGGKPEIIPTGRDEDYKIIKDKNQSALFEHIGFNKHLDEICAGLGINPAKSLDV